MAYAIVSICSFILGCVLTWLSLRNQCEKCGKELEHDWCITEYGDKLYCLKCPNCDKKD